MTLPNPKLTPFRIPNLPPNFYYIPDFLTPAEESSLLQKIPPQRWTHLSHRRLQAHPSTLTANNTLLAAPLPAYLVNPVVGRLSEYGVFESVGCGGPNHVLINEYKAGEGIMPHEDGAAYESVVATVSLGGGLCLDISCKPRDHAGECGDGAVGAEDDVGDGNGDGVEGWQGEEYRIPTRILQEPRSLLITTGTAYRDYMHGIAPIEVDEDLGPETVANWELLGDKAVFEQQGGRNIRVTRTSLTYRHVLKVSRAASKVFGGSGRR